MISPPNWCLFTLCNTCRHSKTSPGAASPRFCPEIKGKNNAYSGGEFSSCHVTQRLCAARHLCGVSLPSQGCSFPCGMKWFLWKMPALVDGPKRASLCRSRMGIWSGEARYPQGQGEELGPTSSFLKNSPCLRPLPSPLLLCRGGK